MNPLSVAFWLVPTGVIYFIHGMTMKYAFLLSRNMTEKEAVARNRYVQTSKVQDDILKQKVTIMQGMKNIWKAITRKNPKSVLTIAREDNLNPSKIPDVTDNDIEGNYSSSSSE